MAKYLRPRRGTLANADSQNLLLKKGELFFEYPVGSVGMAPAKLMIGNGITQYTSSNPVTTDTSGSSTNSFAPALVHPVLYRPKFTDSNCATSDWTFNAGTEAISNIKPWVNTSNQGSLLPNIIGNIKQALCNHADSLTKLNNDLHYMHYETEEAVYLSSYLDQGVYTFPTSTTIRDLPDGGGAGNTVVLEVYRNIKNPTSGDIFVNQILYYNNNTYNRKAVWNGSGATAVAEWGNWFEYVPLSKIRKIGSTVVALSYNSSTMLKGTVNTSSTVYGKANSAWVQLRVQSQTPYTSVKELIIDGPLDGNSSTFVVYATGSGFVNGHVLSVIAYWTY